MCVLTLQFQFYLVFFLSLLYLLQNVKLYVVCSILGLLFPFFEHGMDLEAFGEKCPSDR